MNILQTVPQEFPDGETTFLIDGPSGKLEVKSLSPKTVSRRDVLVICHPHPLQEGTMHNKVVTTLAKAAANCGMRSVRFNFRGVGASEGTFDKARGEVDDLKAVVAYVKTIDDTAEISLAGFSFGSFVAAALASQMKGVRFLISIAPPVHHYDFHHLTSIRCPWLIVQGDDDDVVPAEQVHAWVDTLDPAPRYHRFDKVGHFFHGQLVPLRRVIEEFLV